MNGTTWGNLPAVRVLLVGDDPLARGGLHAMLERVGGLTVVGQLRSEELGGAASSQQADVVVWDLGLDARAALSRLRSARTQTLPILALVADERNASEVLGAGARGVAMRDAQPLKLATAAAAVSRGSVVIDESLARVILPASNSRADPPVEALTPRELEVLQLLALGLANKAIASRLSISEHTAKFHVNAILAKLGVDSRTEAVVRAARLGLVIF